MDDVFSFKYEFMAAVGPDISLEGTRRIAALVETFIEMGGNMMTLTITSVEELRRAMENPEKYRGLRVRMGGWSAYYTLLSKESQKIHLKRVEHGLV